MASDSLPEEIRYIIASKLARPSDLKSLLLTSRTCYVATLPQLYRKVFLSFDETDEQKIQGFCPLRNTGLQYVRRLEILPQSKERPIEEIRRWNSDDGTDFASISLPENRSESIDRMIYRIIDAMAADQLTTLIAHRRFSEKVFKLLMKKQTMLESFYLDPHEVWVGGIANAKLSNLRSLHVPLTGRYAFLDQFNNGKHAARLIAENPKLEHMIIDNTRPHPYSHYSRDSQNSIGVHFWDGFRQTAMPNVPISRLELHDVAFFPTWNYEAPFVDLSGLRRLYVVNCPQALEIIDAVELCQGHGHGQSLRELFVSNLQSASDDHDAIRQEGDIIRQRLETFLQSSSGLRKISVYLRCSPKDGSPIDVSSLLPHASTLNVLELYAWDEDSMSLETLKELCSSCVNLKQLAFTLHTDYDITKVAAKLDALAQLEDLKALKILAARKIEDMRMEAMYIFKNLSIAAARHGHRSHVNVLAFIDTIRRWGSIRHQIRPQIRHLTSNSDGDSDENENETQDVYIYLRGDVLGRDGRLKKTNPKAASYHDVVYAGEETDLVHWKSVRLG